MQGEFQIDESETSSLNLSALYQHLGQQNTDAIQKCHSKNSFSSTVFSGINVVGKKCDVANQTPYAKKCDKAFLIHKPVYKFIQGNICKTNKIDD
jgi:phosphoenolpyruvate carboxylase